MVDPTERRRIVTLLLCWTQEQGLEHQRADRLAPSGLRWQLGVFDASAWGKSVSNFERCGDRGDGGISYPCLTSALHCLRLLDSRLVMWYIQVWSVGGTSDGRTDNTHGRCNGEPKADS